MDEPAYHLDIEDPVGSSRDRPPSTSHSEIEGEESAGARSTSLFNRPWIGIHFECCGIYTRIYRNAEGTAYHGHCPRCLRRINLRVGPGGTDARFFVAE